MNESTITPDAKGPVERTGCGAATYLARPTARHGAEQCRQMGIAVGDVIVGRENYYDQTFTETRLTLLWLGEHVAVWRVEHRNWTTPHFASEGEQANWTLDCRQWKKIEHHNKD